MQPDADLVVFILNCLQVFMAAVTVIALVITRVPVIFYSFLEKSSTASTRNSVNEFKSNNSHSIKNSKSNDKKGFFATLRQHSFSTLLLASLHTAQDPLPLWYSLYLATTVFALVYHRLYLSALLLDW